MNIIVPIAGKATGFYKSKFGKPRHAIVDQDIPLLHTALEGLNLIPEVRFTFIVNKQQFKDHDLGSIIAGTHFPDVKVHYIDAHTDGKACSVQWAFNDIENEDPILIVSPEVVTTWDPAKFLRFVEAAQAHMAIVCCRNPKFGVKRSWFDINKDTLQVDRFVENEETANPHDDVERLSDCGIYYFRFGYDFIRFTRDMIHRQAQINGEFDIPPMINDAIMAHRDVRAHIVDTAHYLQRPKDVRSFERIHTLNREAT
jgi:ADP-glucose pyrophosphorylase